MTDPSAAIKEAFLLNCDNTDAAVLAAKEDFKLTISFDANGNVVVTTPEGYNVPAKIWGATTLGE